MQKVRAIFLSDLHLGCKNCQAEKLLSFLQSYETEKLYLLGDIIDCWQLRLKWYWPPSHNKIIQFLLKMSVSTEIFYLLGNHDKALEQYLLGFSFGNLWITDVVQYKNKKNHFLLLHGDSFDVFIQEALWITKLSDFVYELMVTLNININRVRTFLCLKPWSFSRWMKYNVKCAVNIISDFEGKLVAAANKANCNGVICGHIHHAIHKEIQGVDYWNCGDFIESCVAIIEDLDGNLKIVNWDGTDFKD